MELFNNECNTCNFQLTHNSNTFLKKSAQLKTKSKIQNFTKYVLQIINDVYSKSKIKVNKILAVAFVLAWFATV